MAMEAVSLRVSNRSRANAFSAIQARHGKVLNVRKHRTTIGSASIDLKEMLGLEGIARSTIKGSWSDTYHKPAHSQRISHSHLLSMLAKPAPLLLKVGATQTVKAIEYRGEPCLFDWCASAPHAIHERLHQPKGSLPVWRPQKRETSPLKLEADAAVAAFRAARQLAYTQALIELASR